MKDKLEIEFPGYTICRKGSFAHFGAVKIGRILIAKRQGPKKGIWLIYSKDTRASRAKA